MSEYDDDNYALSFCHISFVKIENGILKGSIAAGVESHPYKDLDALEDCGKGLNLFFVSSSLSIFPNPTLSDIRIKNIGYSNSESILQLEVIDAIGRKIRFYKKEEGILVGEEWIINVSELAAGLYFFKLISNNREEVFRVVKQ